MMVLASRFSRCLSENSVSSALSRIYPSVCLTSSKSFSTCCMQRKKRNLSDFGLPEPPVRPQRPFLKFISSLHRTLPQQPHLAWPDRYRILVSHWKEKSEEEKAQNLLEYNEEKKIYLAKYEEYHSQLTPDQLATIEEAVKVNKQNLEHFRHRKEKKKELEGLGKPKHPENCFFLFMKTLDHGEMSRKEHVISAGAKWRDLPESKKKEFIEEGKRRVQRYEADVETWEQRMVAEGRHSVLRKTSSHRKAEKGRKDSTSVIPLDDNSSVIGNSVERNTQPTTENSAEKKTYPLVDLNL